MASTRGICIFSDNVQAQGQAGFAALSFEKPRCPLVPCTNPKMFPCAFSLTIFLIQPNRTLAFEKT